MNTQSYQALRDGIVGYFQGKHAFEDRAEEKKIREAMLKRQIERDTKEDEARSFDRAMRAKQIELAANADRREGRKLMDDNMRGAMDDVLKQVEASRRGQETAARVDLLKAQSSAVSAKPSSPLAAQLDGLDDFGANMATALTENNAALQAQQAAHASGDPAAKQAADLRVLKAQVKLSGLQQIAAGWQKNTQKEPTVDIEMPGEDGQSKMRMKVPQSQWNERHPLWTKFATPPAAAAGPSGSAKPAMNQQQVLDAVKAGKMTRDEAMAYGKAQGWN